MEIWDRQKSESEQPTPNLDQKENMRGVEETVKRAHVQKASSAERQRWLQRHHLVETNTRHKTLDSIKGG